jgi:hypothetical protein
MAITSWIASPERGLQRGTRYLISAKVWSARCVLMTTNSALSISLMAGGAKKLSLTCPTTNLRLDPFERTGWPNNGTKEGGQQYFDWFKYQFWRFVFVQQVVGKQLQTFIEFPPMQRGASFNLDAVKAEMAKRMQQAEAASKGAGQ